VKAIGRLLSPEPESKPAHYAVALVLRVALHEALRGQQSLTAAAC
jgi:hypothetical protein